jgi:hypothetical protein
MGNPKTPHTHLDTKQFWTFAVLGGTIAILLLANLIVLTIFAFGAKETKVLLEEMNGSMIELTGQTDFLMEQFNAAGSKIEAMKQSQMFRKTNIMLEKIYSEEAANATWIMYQLLQTADSVTKKLLEYPEPTKAILSIIDIVNTILSANNPMLENLQTKLPKIVNNSDVIVSELANLVSSGALGDIRATISKGLNFTTVGFDMLDKFSKNKKVTVSL